MSLVAAGAGLGATTALTIEAETLSQLTAPGGLATFAGNLTGMAGTYLALLMVLLVSRIPYLERVLGQNGLLAWHRRLAPWPISLLVAHAVFITAGYAQAASAGPWREVDTLILSYPDVLAATAGLALMCLAGVMSVRVIRQRVRREVWWTVHLYLYLALALSFAHVIVLGPSFVGHPVTQAVWSVAWAGTAGLVLAYRVGLPVVRSLRYRLRVADVRPEGPGVVSVICRGRHLDRLAVSGGQFFCWRFLTADMWWQAVKGTPWLVLAGTVAGLVGVLSFHTRPVRQVSLPASGFQGAGGRPSGVPTSPSARPTAGARKDGGSVRSALGPDMQFGYGALDVKVTVSGTRITDISVPSLQTAEPTSQQISEQAIPVLRTEALAAQSASIDAVSGATYTSAAYAQSLQAALDRLHVR